MNQNEFNNSSSSQPETYRATTNLNIDIENPQINMNSVVGINIKNIDNTPNPNDRFSNTNSGSYSNFQNVQGSSIGNINYSTPQNEIQNFNSSVTQLNNTMISGNENTNYEAMSTQFVPNTSNDNLTTGGYSESNSNFSEKAIYEPIMEEKKQKDSNFSVPKELKLIIFIVLVLFIFTMVMPSIYDFFKDLQLTMAR